MRITQRASLFMPGRRPSPCFSRWHPSLHLDSPRNAYGCALFVRNRTPSQTKMVSFSVGVPLIRHIKGGLHKKRQTHINRRRHLLVEMGSSFHTVRLASLARQAALFHSAIRSSHRRANRPQCELALWQPTKLLQKSSAGLG